MVLLYEPDLLDAWIGRRIEKLEGGSFADMESGKTLNKQEGKSHKAYLKRDTSRNEEARLADKLFHIADKHLPLQADETRAYIARFPAQVKDLLPKARKIRNKLRREGGPASIQYNQILHRRGTGGTDRDLQVETATQHWCQQRKQPKVRQCAREQ